jgi:long-chain acyl-CoA synthetase
MIRFSESTLSSLCLASAEKHKNRLAFAMISDGQICRRVTYRQFGTRARQIGLLLMQLGVEKGGRVLLLSENCPEWPLAYFGIALAGGVSVPLLTGFSREEIHHIISHSGVSAVCLTRTMAEKFDNSCFSEKPFVFIDSIDGDEEAAEITVSIGGSEKRMALCTEEDLSEPFVSELSSADDLATIIYTSGTQGSSKGVMLSSANLISSALSSLAFKKVYPRDRFLSLLPLAHSYECGLGLLAPVISGSSVSYLDRPPSPSVLLPAVKLVRPTVMFSVPLLIEKVYNNAIAPKLKNSKLYKLSITRPLAIWVAGKKLISALGGRIRIFGIGGAPLSPEVEKFLYRARFPYTIGYGLTETAPLVAGNTPLRHPVEAGIGAAEGVSLRIAKYAVNLNHDEGEIQVRGPNVMLGYYNDEARTAEAFTSDGWLRTGDLGRLDENDRLHIRGRLKALILGPSGENIYPEEIEGLLGSSQLVEDALVYSGNKGELVALVRLSDTARAAAGGIEHVLEELRLWANKKLSAFSRLSRIEIRYEPFEKTPTMKIKRYLYV